MCDKDGVALHLKDTTFQSYLGFILLWMKSEEIPRMTPVRQSDPIYIYI